MAYKIKVACEIANKKYAEGQIVQEGEVAFYPSLMEEVNCPAEIEEPIEAPESAPEKADEEAEIEEPIEAPKKKKK